MGQLSFILDISLLERELIIIVSVRATEETSDDALTLYWRMRAWSYTLQ